jgi:hypothetical protein
VSSQESCWHDERSRAGHEVPLSVVIATRGGWEALTPVQEALLEQVRADGPVRPATPNRSSGPILRAATFKEEGSNRISDRVSDRVRHIPPPRPRWGV